MLYAYLALQLHSCLQMPTHSCDINLPKASCNFAFCHHCQGHSLVVSLFASCLAYAGICQLDNCMNSLIFGKSFLREYYLVGITIISFKKAITKK